MDARGLSNDVAQVCQASVNDTVNETVQKAKDKCQAAENKVVSRLGTQSGRGTQSARKMSKKVTGEMIAENSTLLLGKASQAGCEEIIKKWLQRHSRDLYPLDVRGTESIMREKEKSKRE